MADDPNREDERGIRIPRRIKARGPGPQGTACGLLDDSSAHSRSLWHRYGWDNVVLSYESTLETPLCEVGDFEVEAEDVGLLGALHAHLRDENWMHTTDLDETEIDEAVLMRKFRLAWREVHAIDSGDTRRSRLPSSNEDSDLAIVSAVKNMYDRLGWFKIADEDTDFASPCEAVSLCASGKFVVGSYYEGRDELLEPITVSTLDRWLPISFTLPRETGSSEGGPGLIGAAGSIVDPNARVCFALVAHAWGLSASRTLLSEYGVRQFNDDSEAWVFTELMASHALGRRGCTISIENKRGALASVGDIVGQSLIPPGLLLSTKRTSRPMRHFVISFRGTVVSVIKGASIINEYAGTSATYGGCVADLHDGEEGYETHMRVYSSGQSGDQQVAEVETTVSGRSMPARLYEYSCGGTQSNGVILNASLGGPLQGEGCNCSALGYSHYAALAWREKWGECHGSSPHGMYEIDTLWNNAAIPQAELFREISSGARCGPWTGFEVVRRADSASQSHAALWVNFLLIESTITGLGRAGELCFAPNLSRSKTGQVKSVIEAGGAPLASLLAERGWSVKTVPSGNIWKTFASKAGNGIEYEFTLPRGEETGHAVKVRTSSVRIWPSDVSASPIPIAGAPGVEWRGPRARRTRYNRRKMEEETKFRNRRLALMPVPTDSEGLRNGNLPRKACRTLARVRCSKRYADRIRGGSAPLPDELIKIWNRGEELWMLIPVEIAGRRREYSKIDHIHMAGCYGARWTAVLATVGDLHEFRARVFSRLNSQSPKISLRSKALFDRLMFVPIPANQTGVESDLSDETSDGPDDYMQEYEGAWYPHSALISMGYIPPDPVPEEKEEQMPSPSSGGAEWNAGIPLDT